MPMYFIRIFDVPIVPVPCFIYKVQEQVSRAEGSVQVCKEWRSR